MNLLQKRTWAEINLANLEHNYRALRALLPQHCRFLGVVKAESYGHGAIPVAKRLEALDAEYLAVACLDEALELRQAGLTSPILILGHTPPEYVGDLLSHNLTQTVFDLDTGRTLSQAATAAGDRLKIHIKADTGMSRLGFLCDETHLTTSAQAIATLCALPSLDAEGIYTHFSDADGNEEYTMSQFTRFLDLLDLLKEKSCTFSIRHCAASSAVLNYPCTHLDMVRPGIALYGHYPHPSTEGLDGFTLLPVMTLKTRVVSVKELPAGTPVSYGRTYVLNHPSRLATLSIGYADGLFRSCSNQIDVLIHGVRCPIVGRICMDMCMADVSAIPEVLPGDPVEIFGEHIPVEEAAQIVGTIQYELISAISPRVPRIYQN